MTLPIDAPELHSTPRLAAIADLGLKDPRPDPVLQELVEEAAERLNLPIGLVTIVLDGAQLFAAHRGLEGWMAEAGGIPVEWSFCRNSVGTGEPFVVPDAVSHPVTRDNPLVTEENIRCYAGIPLVTSGGQVLGNFCVVGTDAARSFSEQELDILRGLARRAVERIETRQG